ncbi:nucleoside triphosphate pyrophosphohydrolase family protein [Xanthobacter wiegelii]|uniref:nucleoside triphosphate pyrophosphohydrolase family protein n=1 Tax=Xanthobacter wiegelii TaxID=3119913 RepID=UPI00372728BE
MIVDARSLMREQASLFTDDDAPLALDEYQQFTARTDKNGKPGIEGLGFVLLGLFGEVGSLLSALKKKQRDKESFSSYHDEVIEELGDALWYFANASLRAGMDLSDIAERARLSLADWTYRGKAGATTFVDLQQHDIPFAQLAPGEQVEASLLALAGRVGVLLSHWSSGQIHDNGDQLSADLVEIFRALLIAADDAQVSLDTAARQNVVKTFGRWPEKRTWDGHFDSDFPEYERLPRIMRVEFIERTHGAHQQVVMRYNGVNLGSPLTDNRQEADDYRYHDVFHLAFAGILGWSPTLRALLRIKRKSDPAIDENEDGARANIIEEGISTWIFNHGLRHDAFKHVKSLDYALLKAVRELVTGYEVAQRPLWQWEHAILEGFRIFRELREHRNGIVTIDLNQRTINFETMQ